MIYLENTLALRKKPFRLATIVMPILITQVALYMMTFFDILMTGRYDTYHLAGVKKFVIHLLQKIIVNGRIFCNG